MSPAQSWEVTIAPAARSLSTIIFASLPDALNLGRSYADSSQGQDLFITDALERDMSKATRIAASIPVSSTSPKSDDHPLASVALLSGVGLLASLVAILMGVQIAWY
jgi:hypothetical protein